MSSETLEQSPLLYVMKTNNMAIIYDVKTLGAVGT